MLALRSGWSLEDKQNEFGCTVLDVAIDARSAPFIWMLLREPMSRPVLLQGLGNQLSHYWHLGSSEMDALLFSFLAKLGHVPAEEGEFLLRRACEGLAWPYILPFLLVSGKSMPSLEGIVPYVVEDNPPLLAQVEADLRRLSERYAREGLPSQALWRLEGGLLYPQLHLLRLRGPFWVNPRSFFRWRSCLRRGTRRRERHGLWVYPRQEPLRAADMRLAMEMLLRPCGARGGSVKGRVRG